MTDSDYKTRAIQIIYALRTYPAPDSQADLVDLLTEITTVQKQSSSLIVSTSILAEMLSCVEQENWIRLADILEFEVNY